MQVDGEGAGQAGRTAALTACTTGMCHARLRTLCCSPDTDVHCATNATLIGVPPHATAGWAWHHAGVHAMPLAECMPPSQGFRLAAQPRSECLYSYNLCGLKTIPMPFCLCAQCPVFWRGGLAGAGKLAVCSQGAHKGGC